MSAFRESAAAWKCTGRAYTSLCAVRRIRAGSPLSDYALLFSARVHPQARSQPLRFSLTTACRPCNAQSILVADARITAGRLLLSSSGRSIARAERFRWNRFLVGMDALASRLWPSGRSRAAVGRPDRDQSPTVRETSRARLPEPEPLAFWPSRSDEWRCRRPRQKYGVGGRMGSQVAPLAIKFSNSRSTAAR